jgi:biotin carboxyl carrier protein
MHFELEIAGRTRKVVVTRTGAAFAVEVDGRTRQVEAAAIGAHTLSLLVDDAFPHDVVIAADRPGHLTVTVDGTAVPVVINGRRRIRHDDAGGSGTGAQKLVAPMPGKVLRVLIRPGDVVEARQPLVVVEAMKMENELRAARAGTVSEVHAREGQSVDAGTLLVTIL